MNPAPDMSHCDVCHAENETFRWTPEQMEGHMASPEHVFRAHASLLKEAQKAITKLRVFEYRHAVSREELS